MTQWLPALTALAGVALGFFLNLVAERRREAREDRLRFVQEKLRVYAEFTNVCKRVERLKGNVDSTLRRKDELTDQLEQLIEQYGGGAEPSQLPGGGELEAGVEAVTASIDAQKAEVEDVVREMEIAVSALDLLSPEAVRVAAGRLADAVSNEIATEEDYDVALRMFVQAAARDLGLRQHA